MERDLAEDARERAAADHAVARRRRVFAHRPAQSRAPLSVGARGRRDRRTRGGQIARRDRRSHHHRHRRHERRHRAHRRRQAADRAPKASSTVTRCACRWSTSTRSARAAGSIAWIDAAKSLRVGPHSAGSEPGPACYGRGGDGGDGDRRIDRAGLYRSGVFRGRHDEAPARARVEGDRARRSRGRSA